MKVSLITHTPNPEKLVAAAAKFCYSPADTDAIMDGLTPEKTAKFLDMLVELGHESPVEHVTFTFAIEGVSRSLLAQITRHRIASFSVQSQRYVAENKFEYVVPPAIADGDELIREGFEDAMYFAQHAYAYLSGRLCGKYMAAGMSEKDAVKKAQEDARYVLPNACTTKIMMTMNVRSLWNFFKLRCCNRAQWEIRELAWQMLHICRDVAPILFKYAGPPCAGGICTEGAMTCGKPYKRVDD